MDITAETLWGITIGLGLSAACGFRVFLPPLVAGIAAKAGYLNLAEGFQWLGSSPALIAFGVAATCEILAYYIPWVDNALDAIAGPAAVIAGTVLSASMVGDLSPLSKWSLALIAGGGSAGLLHAATACLRGGSTLTTGGLSNPLLSTMEAGGAVTFSLLAILSALWPAIALVLLFLALGVIALAIRKWSAKCRPTSVPPSYSP